MKSTEKASGQTMLSGERLAKTYDALLETARGRSETLESGRAKEFASVNWRRMAGGYGKDSACHTPSADFAVLEHLVPQG
ncbi:MAG: hypothetical protein ACLRP8_04410 [Roseburia intestinalis]